MNRRPRDPVEAARLADSASSRLLYRYAIPLYRHAADAVDKDALSQLVKLLAARGELDELRVRTGTGDRPPASGCPGCWKAGPGRAG